MPIYFLTIPFFRKVCYNKYMESMGNGEKKTIIAIRLLSAAVLIFVFAGATAIKKPIRGSNDNKNLFEIAFLDEVNRKTSDDTIAKENDDPEVPATATPEEKTEEKVEEKVEEKPVAEEASPQATPQYTTKTIKANTSNASTPVSHPSPNHPANYDAGSPYAGQVYVDGGEAPELHNPTYYDSPGGNPNVVVEEPEPVAPTPVEDPEEKPENLE